MGARCRSFTLNLDLGQPGSRGRGGGITRMLLDLGINKTTVVDNSSSTFEKRGLCRTTGKS